MRKNIEMLMKNFSLFVTKYLNILKRTVCKIHLNAFVSKVERFVDNNSMCEYIYSYI